MLVVQALSYFDGSRITCGMGGIASGLQGSRKHSRYGDEELVLGIPFALANRIDRALARIPPTFP